MNGSTKVALATCRELPTLCHDDLPLVEAFASIGVTAEPAVWDDSSVPWPEYDLTIVRSCWDYHERRAEFVRWAYDVGAVANPPDVIDWNTDKRYLAGLADVGVPVVPTTWVTPADDWAPPDSGVWVAKPSVSLSGLNAGRYDTDDHTQRALMQHHVRSLLGDRAAVMIQPYQSAIDAEGETALIFIGGQYSHAIRKPAVLTGPAAGADHRFDHDGGLQLARCEPTAEELDVAEMVLGQVPGGRERLLYARVDLIPGPGATPLLMELELTEPQLFLTYAVGAADALAVAAAGSAGPHRMSPPVIT